MWNQLIQLSFRSKVGLQAQIREMLVAAILDGHIPVGVALPSTRVLAAQLGVARNTVALAYELLVNEGYLLTKSRSGHFVNPEIVAGRAGLPRPPGSSATPSPARWPSRLRGAVSAQRNIVKPRDWQRYPYPFIYGQIDPAQLPIPGWRECSLQATSASEVRGWAGDLIDGDDALLIEQIQTRLLVRRGVFVSPEEILVTVGAQHALFLLATLLVDAGTTVGIENPGYPDARNIFAARTANVVAVAARRRGPRAHTRARSLRLRLSDAVAPMPDQRDDAARATRGAARLGPGERSHADRGRLRDRARLRRPRAARAAEPRPQRPRRLREQPVEDARAGDPHRLHRRQSRPDPRIARAAAPDASPSCREQRALGRACSSRWGITTRCCDGCARRTPNARSAWRQRSSAHLPQVDLHDGRRRVVVLAALSRTRRHAARSRSEAAKLGVLIEPGDVFFDANAGGSRRRSTTRGSASRRSMRRASSPALQRLRVACAAGRRRLVSGLTPTRQAPLALPAPLTPA